MALYSSPGRWIKENISNARDFPIPGCYLVAFFSILFILLILTLFHDHWENKSTLLKDTFDLSLRLVYRWPYLETDKNMVSFVCEIIYTNISVSEGFP